MSERPQNKGFSPHQRDRTQKRAAGGQVPAFQYFTHGRFRRLRQSEAFRRLAKNTLSARNFILPLFAVPGSKIKREISSLSGNYHLSIDCLVEEAIAARDLGIAAVLLFGVPEDKDEQTSGAHPRHGIVQEAVRALKHTVPEMLVITDVCPCEYTLNGHCGIIRNGYLDNDSSLELITKITLSHAEAGSDMVAPGSMLDGQIQAMRHALDSNGCQNLPIMTYSAKFAAKLYDPFFKEGTHSALSFGDKRTHQMDCPNSDEAMREIARRWERSSGIWALGWPEIQSCQETFREQRYRSSVRVAAKLSGVTL
jgi:porphobilinogen synthase